MLLKQELWGRSQLTDAELEAAESIIRAATTDIYQKVYFLGPYARRVSFSSMQNRALNLVWALQGLDRIEKGDHVAVVGGGLSGVTATAALLDLGYTVTIYEDGENVMHRQSSADHRYLHPTVNRWPERPVEETTTVPYFDWVSSVCADVVKKLRAEWANTRMAPELTFVPHATVNGFQETSERVGVGTDDTCPTRDERYKVVMVTSGFAEEDYGSKHMFPGYWRPDGLEADLAAPEFKKTKFLISGCGDGGLIDALRVAHVDFEKGELIVRVARDLYDRGWDGLKTIEDAEAKVLANPGVLKDAIQNGSDELRLAYEDAAKKMPVEVKTYLKASLRLDRGIGFITLLSREKNPYSPMSAPIHKLLIAYAMDEMVISHRCCVVAGPVTTLDHVMVAPCGTKLEDLAAAPKERLNGRVILRHGAQPNFKKFFGTGTAAEDLIDRQKMLAANLDRRFWSEGADRLKHWPPERGFAHELTKRMGEAIALIRRMTKLHGGKIDVAEDDGFIFYHTESEAAAVRAARLPEKLFGFNLEVVEEETMELAPTDAAGAAEGSAGSTGSAGFSGIARPGTSIVGSLNGRLGPICVDPSGQLVAITARHLAPSGPFWEIPVHDTHSTSVGTFIKEGGNQSDLALIALKDDIRIESFYAGIPRFTGTIDAHEAFGEPVFLERVGGARTLGYVNATRVGASFRHPGSGHKIELRNLVRVRSADPSSRFAVTGDSGAPVVSGDGRLLGIVVCNDSAFTYVLSCEPFMSDNGLRLFEEVRPAPSQGQTEDASEIGVMADIINLYAAANRRDQSHHPLDLGKPPVIEKEEEALAEGELEFE